MSYAIESGKKLPGMIFALFTSIFVGAHMSNISRVNNAAAPLLSSEAQNTVQPAEQSLAFSSALTQAVSSTSISLLTPSIASSLMHRSMTTGVPTKEFEAYGGYDAVKAEFEKNGGTYSLDDIPSEERHQLAQIVADTGVGNMSVLAAENMPQPDVATQKMAASVLNLAIEVPTASTAANLMARSMTTGVATSEFQQYGGYDSVKTVFEANGGTYDLNAIPSDQRKLLAQEIANTGVGNMALLLQEHIDIPESVKQTLSAYGIELNLAQTAFVDSERYIDSFMNSRS